MKNKRSHDQPVPYRFSLAIQAEDAPVGNPFFRRRPLEVLWQYVLAYLFAVSSTFLLLAALSLNTTNIRVVILCGLTVFYLYLLRRFPRVMWSVTAVWLLLVVAGLLVNIGWLSSLSEPFRELYLLLKKQIGLGADTADAMGMPSIRVVNFVCVIATLFSSMMLIKTPLFFAPFIYASVCFAFAEVRHGSILLSDRGLYLSALAVLILMRGSGLVERRRREWRRRKKQPVAANDVSRRRRSLVLGAVLMGLIISLDVLLPTDFFYIKELDDRFSRLLGTRHRQNEIGYQEFSLYDLGYYPLETRLGGKPDPAEEPFAYVTTSAETVYLKGAAYYSYTGLSWIQEGMNPNWLMNHKRNRTVQDHLLGQPAIERDEISRRTLRDHHFDWKPADDQQVVFQAGRPMDYQYLNSQSPFSVYFNRSGSMYLDRLVPEDGYFGVGQAFDVRKLAEPGMLRTFVHSYQASEPERLVLSQEERTSWTMLPTLPTLRASIGLAGEELESLIYGQPTLLPEDRAAAIRDYLAEHFHYTLDVTTPPDDIDFVSYFLNSGEGYCTYFGSALTVLLREAGIPARYVEGFVVPAVALGESPVRELSGRQAHAWTEVWFDGVGWVPLDATPSDTLDRLDGTAHVHEVRHTTTTTSVAGQTPTRSPVPPSPSPSDVAGQHGAHPSPGFNPWKRMGIWLILIIVLLSIALYITWRNRIYHRRHDRSYLMKHAADHSAASLVEAVYADLTDMWKLQGMSRAPHETLRRFLDRIGTERGKSCPRQVITMLEHTSYGRPDDKETKLMTQLETLFDYYDAEEAYLKSVLKKRRWLFKRYLWSTYHPLPRKETSR